MVIVDVNSSLHLPQVLQFWPWLMQEQLVPVAAAVHNKAGA